MSNSSEKFIPASAAFAAEAGSLMKSRHCENVLLLDVSSLSQVCDYVLIGTGTSDRQMKSVADEISMLGKENNFQAFRTSVDSYTTWIVVDFINVVIHLFEPELRAYYDLEDLWAEAKIIELPEIKSS